MSQGKCTGSLLMGLCLWGNIAERVIASEAQIFGFRFIERKTKFQKKYLQQSSTKTVYIEI